jgi:hypothetical protein
MHTDIRAAPGFCRGRRTFFPDCAGYRIFMSSSSYDRIEQRAAELLPEERSAGSADPQAQAEAVLAESDEREADVDAAPDSFLEHRTSEQAAPPADTTR